MVGRAPTSAIPPVISQRDPSTSLGPGWTGEHLSFSETLPVCIEGRAPYTDWKEIQGTGYPRSSLTGG